MKTVVVVVVVIAIAALCASLIGVNAGGVQDLLAKYENLGSNVESSRPTISRVSSSELEEQQSSTSSSDSIQEAVSLIGQDGPEATVTLIAWISSQSESIVEELEAIVQQNSVASKFSVVNYLRYLTLYTDLKVVARQPYEELKWVVRKARAFEGAYDTTLEAVNLYLHDIDRRLTELELKEPKSTQRSVSNKWLELYETIRYIAHHAPEGTALRNAAKEMLASSPDNTPDKARDRRYKLAINPFHRR